MPNKIHAWEGRGGQAMKKEKIYLFFSPIHRKLRVIWAILSRGSKTAQNGIFLVAPSVLPIAGNEELLPLTPLREGSSARNNSASTNTTTDNASRGNARQDMKILPTERGDFSRTKSPLRQRQHKEKNIVLECLPGSDIVAYVEEQKQIVDKLAFPNAERPVDAETEPKRIIRPFSNVGKEFGERGSVWPHLLDFLFELVRGSHSSFLLKFGLLDKLLTNEPVNRAQRSVLAPLSGLVDLCGPQESSLAASCTRTTTRTSISPCVSSRLLVPLCPTRHPLSLGAVRLEPKNLKRGAPLEIKYQGPIILEGLCWEHEHHSAAAPGTPLFPLMAAMHARIFCFHTAHGSSPAMTGATAHTLSTDTQRLLHFVYNGLFVRGVSVPVRTSPVRYSCTIKGTALSTQSECRPTHGPA
ncbi:hypothetical protein C8R44DRAFT_732963 [Mycena epipterygia]|nr:hypothetical protein C8R44DRAFT_732963 [Mycena epipterygia]